jgi:signal transduction histidine kinase
MAARGRQDRAAAERAKMKSITSRFVMLIATAAIAPLVIYGVVSVKQLRSGTEESVTKGNLGIATQAAAQINQYIENNQRVLRSIAMELRTTGLEAWQQSRILKDTVLDFPEFRELSIFDSAGHPLGTSRFGPPTVSIPDRAAAANRAIVVAPLKEDNDALPATTIAVRLVANDPESGWVVGELALEELWRMVDRIKVGESGRAALFSEKNRLVAHGNADKKRLVASAKGDSRIEQTAVGLRKQQIVSTFYNDDESGAEQLAVGALIPSLDWLVMVEQPKSEAFQVATRLERQLLAVIGAALLGTIIVGSLWGRSFLTRIFALRRATLAIAEGRFDERVTMKGEDELKQLGDSFNSMADSIVQLQEDVRKQERQAMFGRIAAGLVHDLSHPIQNIGNSCKLIQKMFDDVEYRETFKRTVEREMVVIKRVLDDLRNIARPIPLERFPIEVDRSLAEVVESMQQHAETAGLTLRAELASPGAFIDGDLFALGRVYRNLIVNAIQATAPGGLVVVATEVARERVQIRVYDTGCGIPADRLGKVFEDFVTTKRRGLGLGLAISKKIVEQLGGQISVASEVGKGTTFVLEFPRTHANAIQQAG